MIPIVRCGLMLAALTLAVSAGPVETRPPNDDFANRKVLPSVDDIVEPLTQVAGASQEPLEPLWNVPSLYNGTRLRGTLWWTWKAPNDGWYAAHAPGPLTTQRELGVYTGETLETLLPVLNGNDGVMAYPSGRILFRAEQDETFQICVAGSWPIALYAPDPDNGSLIIRSAAGPPANDTLATRHVLSGDLPLTVSASNITERTTEREKVKRMQNLKQAYLYPDSLDAVLWWEWRCPQSGRYWLKLPESMNRAGSEDLGFFAARRRTLPDGESAPPGDWEITGMAPRLGTFLAEEGKVYDLALATFTIPSDYEVASYDEITFSLSRWPGSGLNTTRYTATELPSQVPLDVTLELRPDPDPDDPNLSTTSLWWKYVAPEDGVYEIDSTDLMELRGPPKMLAWERTVLLRKGSGLLLHFQRQPYHASDVRVKIRRTSIPQNDARADAQDLGSAHDFELKGHRDLATLEPDEPPAGPPERDPRNFGTMWWRWTAPADGWLTEEHSFGAAQRVEVFIGSLSGQIQPVAENSAGLIPVQGGVSYMIRLVIDFWSEGTMFYSHYIFEPAQTAGGWAGARDLGKTDRPAWLPPFTVFLNTRPAVREYWFKWTAKSTGFASVDSGIEMMIFTNPGAGIFVEPVPRTQIWRFEVGQTYWIRLRTSGTFSGFAVQSVQFAGSPHISNAAVLRSELPCAGRSSFLLDTNTEEENAIMKDFLAGTSEPSDCPVIWWKWRAPEDQLVRLKISSAWRSVLALQVFAGAAPARGNAIPMQTGINNWDSWFFRAKRGELYWIAAAGYERSQDQEFYAAVELNAVRKVSPPNDHFASATAITPVEWNPANGAGGVHQSVRRHNPLYFEEVQATVEDGEPRLPLLVGEDGIPVRRTASTWWSLTAPSGGLFKFAIYRTAEEDLANLPAIVAPLPDDDLTAEVFSGITLAGLKSVPAWETIDGSYVFQAEPGARYSIRVASSARTSFYKLVPMLPSGEDIYDFRAFEELRYDQIGRGLADDAGDGIPNYIKLLFGLDITEKFTSPVNDPVRGNLPHRHENADALEIRFRLDPRLLPGGEPGYLVIHGMGGWDLYRWEMFTAQHLGNGEMAVRVPKTRDRAFLKMGLWFDYQYVEIYE